MSLIIGMAVNYSLMQIGEQAIPMAELVITSEQPSYVRDENDGLKRLMQIHTHRFTITETSAKAFSLQLIEISEGLEVLSETQGNAIALRGENKVLRDLLGESLSAFEDNGVSGVDQKLVDAIKAAIAGRA